jgi:hypothetical protein
VSDALAPIADKLKRFIRLLSSDSDGEVVAAARALNRTLKGAKLDIHVLANSIGQANGKKWGDDHVLEAYKRGVEDGRREAESEPVFRNANIDAEPTWHEIAVECAAHSDRLHSDRERQFVKDMVRLTVHGGELTEKQGSWLRKIYARVQR